MPASSLRDVEVVIVERDGTPVDVIDGALPEQSTEQLNGQGSGTFTFPTTHAKWASVQLLGREVQFRESNVCKWWGVPIVGRADRKRTTIECAGASWYYWKRQFGPNVPEGATLSNGGFESGLTGWSAVNLDSATVSSTIRARGTQAARLVNSTTGEDAFLRQIVVATNSLPPGGAVSWALSARYYIDPAVAFNGAAFRARGLFAEVTTGGVPGDLKFATIPWAGTKTGEWHELYIPAIGAPTGATSDIDIRLYGVNGAIVWDEVTLLPEQFIGDLTLAYNDYSVLIEDVLDYAESKGTSIEMAHNVRSTGKTTNKLYRKSEHGVIGNAIDDWAAAGIADWGVTWDADGTQKTFETWSPRGSTLPDRALELNRNILEIRSYEVNGQAAVNKGRGLGSGQGATRAVAEYEDTADLDGLVLEGTVQVPPETELLDLDLIVREEVDRLKRGPKAVTVLVPTSYLDAVSVGDTVPVNIDWGFIQIDNENMRIVQATRYHTRGTGELVLNQV